MSPEDVNNSSEDIKSGKGTNIGFQAKLQNLKLAKKTALSKSKKKSVLSRAEDLQSSVDRRIKSIALNKFAVRKAKRLKALGKTKEEINSLVVDLEASQESILSRARSGLKGFGIDQKFLGLSADEVLEKINVEVPVSTKTLSTSSLDGIPVESEKVEKESSNESPTVINNVNVTNNITEEVTQESDGNGVYNESTPDFSASEPMKVQANADTDTEQDVEQNNEKIYDYLVKSGELDIANYVLDIMTQPAGQSKMRISEIKANTEETSRLSDINEDIYGKLEELEAGLRNEQDTSIDVRKKLQDKADIEHHTGSQTEEEKGTGFFEAILSMIFGRGIVSLLKSAAGSVLSLAKTLLSRAWGWLSTKITGLVGPLINSVKKWAKGKLSALGKTISGLGKAISAKLGAGWAATKKKLGLGRADDGVKGAKKSKIPKSKTPKPKKTSRMAKQIKNSKVGNAGKKASKLSKSALGKVKPKGILRKLLRFTKPIPFLGTAIAAGTAIYSAQDGYRNADDILGKDPQKLTVTDKLASAAGSLVNDVSFGVLSTRGTAEKILEWMGNDAIGKAVEKAEKQGIIETNWVGNSEVKDWVSLGSLPSSEIRKIIDHDDWGEEDRQKMENLYAKRKTFEDSTEGSRPSTPEKAETEVTSTGEMDKVEYTMRAVPKNVEAPMVPAGRAGEVPSKNPADYKISDLFSKYQVKDEDIENLHPAVLHNLKSMAAEYLDTYGEKIQVNSAFRSFEEQAEMKEKHGDKAAAPGSSMHNYGVAVDMNTDNAQKAIAAGLFSKYGFHRPVSGETWHVEPDKIDRAAIRENGMAGTPGAADVATSPEGSGSPEVETEGEVPEKSENTQEMVQVDETSKENETTRTRISELESAVVSLKKRKKRAMESGNRRAANAADSGIRSFERKIARIKKSDGLSSQPLGSGDVYKEGRMQAAESMQRSGIDSTKAYDKKMAIVVPGGQGGINNTNVQTGQQGPSSKPSEMFNL